MSSERIENMNIQKVNSIGKSYLGDNKNEMNKNETKPIRYYWFDSYLEFNMYSTKPFELMDLEKRYGVKLSYTPSYDAFIKEINKKKKEEKENEKEKAKSSNVSIKFIESAKSHRSQTVINSHMKTECELINESIKYKDYPNWIKKIINTNSELYEDLKLKSKISGIRFSYHSTIDEFLQNYYQYESMMDRIGW